MSEKHCPKCNVVHFKPGKFCSRKCANSRDWTEEHRKVFSQKQKEYLAQETDETELHKWKLSQKAVSAGLIKLNRYNPEEESVEDYFMIPELDYEDEKTEFTQDGVIWTVYDD